MIAVVRAVEKLCCGSEKLEAGKMPEGSIPHEIQKEVGVILSKTHDEWTKQTGYEVIPF